MDCDESERATFILTKMQKSKVEKGKLFFPQTIFEINFLMCFISIFIFDFSLFAVALVYEFSRFWKLSAEK